VWMPQVTQVKIPLFFTCVPVPPPPQSGWSPPREGPEGEGGRRVPRVPRGGGGGGSRGSRETQARRGGASFSTAPFFLLVLITPFVAKSGPKGHFFLAGGSGAAGSRKNLGFFGRRKKKLLMSPRILTPSEPCQSAEISLTSQWVASVVQEHAR
jgi:hypothetical protein